MRPFIYPMGEKDLSEISGQQHAMICLPRLLINIFVSIRLLSATKLGACRKQGQRLTVPSTTADIGGEAIHTPKAGQRADLLHQAGKESEEQIMGRNMDTTWTHVNGAAWLAWLTG